MTLKEFKSMAQRYGKRMITQKKLQKHGLVHGAWTGGAAYGDTRNILITVIRTGLEDTICVIIMLRM